MLSSELPELSQPVLNCYKETIDFNNVQIYDSDGEFSYYALCDLMEPLPRRNLCSTYQCALKDGSEDVIMWFWLCVGDVDDTGWSFDHVAVCITLHPESKTHYSSDLVLRQLVGYSDHDVEEKEIAEHQKLFSMITDEMKEYLREHLQQSLVYLNLRLQIYPQLYNNYR